MTEAIFGLLGVLIGAGLTWFQTYWLNRQERNRSARYLAIRVACLLDKYVEDCAAVVKDDGLSFGQRNSEGYLEPQVKAPSAPVYPDDIDWKSIDHEMMYKLLSFPSDVEGAEGIIRAAWDLANPPDFEEWFEERAFWHAQFGLAAFKLAEELSNEYGIQKKTYKNWDPVADLGKELDAIRVSREKRFEAHRDFLNKMQGAA